MLKKLTSWLLRVLSSSKTQVPLKDDSEELNVYKIEERLIYTYFNGEKDIKCDPLVLYRRMMDRGVEIGIDIKVSTSPSKGAAAAHISLMKKIREVFDLKSYEDGGLTEMETLNLLDHFMIFCERVKKNSSPSQTSSILSEVSNPSSEESQPTSSSSDSGSTVEGSSTAEPVPSPSVPA